MRRLAPLALLALVSPALGGDETFKLLPSDGATEGSFGRSVAVSGTKVLVGSYWDDDNGTRSGSAYLFDTTTGQQLVKFSSIDGSAGDEFGISVALDGTMALVGARFDDDSGFASGSAYLFDTATGQQLVKLVSEDGESGDQLGASVALGGSLALVGAPEENGSGLRSGAAYLFDAAAGQQLAKLRPTDGTPDKRFGLSVSIRDTVALIGAPSDNENGIGAGSAYLFDVTTGQQLAQLLPDDGAPGDSFGSSVSISGNTVLAGAPGDDDVADGSGSAYLFRPKPWRLSPINGHWYRLLDPASSVAAEAEAQTLGGHLATIRSQAENDWFHGTFAAAEEIWIGYTDQVIEGSFEWTSGEVPAFENWAAGQPDNSLGADWAIFLPGSGEWTDEPSQPERLGVVEVISEDCDGDQLPDAFQIAQEPGLDWNGDGVLDACATSNYCTATSSSTGSAAVIRAAGTPVIADNAFTLQAQDMPLNEFGYFLMSESTAFVPGFGGSDGNLCLGAPIIRFNLQSDGGMILNSGSTGTVSFAPDLGGLPQNTTLLPGDTWYFQLWFRDASSSNTSDGIEVMFR